jgi:hypothetical protein
MWDQFRDQAVAARFRIIRPGLTERPGDKVYSGSYCSPENLGGRFRQRLHTVRATVAEIESGQWDTEIEETWHDAAGAEHWYRYENGRDDIEPESNPAVINGTHHRVVGGWVFPNER